jgi:hypothetical protein
MTALAARDGHGGAVGFQAIPAPLAVEFQTENPVWNDTAFGADVHAPLK